jgi:hypothetical protein
VRSLLKLRAGGHRLSADDRYVPLAGRWFVGRPAAAARTSHAARPSARRHPIPRPRTCAWIRRASVTSSLSADNVWTGENKMRPASHLALTP